jgi:hypothetical protein
MSVAEFEGSARVVSWLGSKVVCLSAEHISPAPCWGSLINRESPAVQKVIGLFILLQDMITGWHSFLLVTTNLDKNICDFPRLLLANARSLPFTLSTSIDLHKTTDVLVHTAAETP